MNQTKNKMKTTTLVTVLSLVVASASFAADPSLAVVNSKENVVKVIYRSEATENVRLKIYNQSGEVVFAETIKGQNGFILPVNFTGLPYGEYKVEITGKNGKKSQTIDYAAAKKAEVVAATGAVKGVHVAKMTNNSKYLFSVNNEGKQRINIRIFDGANNLVHSESRNINGSYGMIYNLEQVIGNPTFEVTDNAGATTVVKK
jgi:flagellar hook assembly protein FlgD